MMTFVPASALARRSFALIGVAYLLFIGIASFYLTRDTLPASGDVLDKLLSQTWGSLRPSLHNLRDVATNILLYMPLGAAFAAWVACRKPIRYLTPALLIGFVVSVTVEVIQAFIGRFSDPADVVSNSAGYIAGYLVMAAAVRVFHLRPASLLGMDLDDSQHSRVSTLSAVRFLYIAIFYFVQLLPLNISVSLQQIYSKLTAANPGDDPRIILDPLHHWQDDNIDAHRLLLRMLAYIPLGALSAVIGVLQRRPSLITPVLHCLLLAMFAETSKVFILNARSDVLTVLLAALAGMASAYCVLRWSVSFRLDSANDRNAEQRQLIVLGIIAYASFVAVLAWSPYQFEVRIGAIKDKLLGDSNLLPFRLHFGTRSIQAAVDLVREFCLFLPLGGLLGILIRQCFHHPQRWLLAIVSAGLCFGYGLALELTQLIIVDRTVDITDPLLGALGAASGSLLTPLLHVGFMTKRPA
jgi:VanZ family protein